MKRQKEGLHHWAGALDHEMAAAAHHDSGSGQWELGSFAFAASETQQAGPVVGLILPLARSVFIFCQKRCCEGADEREHRARLLASSMRQRGDQRLEACGGNPAAAVASLREAADQRPGEFLWQLQMTTSAFAALFQCHRPACCVATFIWENLPHCCNGWSCWSGQPLNIC